MECAIKCSSTDTDILLDRGTYFHRGLKLIELLNGFQVMFQLKITMFIIQR